MILPTNCNLLFQTNVMKSPDEHHKSQSSKSTSDRRRADVPSRRSIGMERLELSTVQNAKKSSTTVLPGSSRETQNFQRRPIGMGEWKFQHQKLPVSSNRREISSDSEDDILPRKRSRAVSFGSDEENTPTNPQTNPLWTLKWTKKTPQV